MSWVAPGGETPPVPPAQPVPPTGEPAPPSTATTGSTAPAAPPPGPNVAKTLVLAIVGGIVLTSTIGGVGTAIQQAMAPPSPPWYSGGDPFTGDYSDLATGDPASPLAVTPTVCPEECFDRSSIVALQLPDHDFNVAGVTEHYASVDDPVPAGELLASAQDSYREAGYDDPACFAVWPEEPLIEPEGADLGGSTITLLASHWSTASNDTGISQAARLFDDSAAAEAYMMALADSLDACPQYDSALSSSDTPITLEPSIDPPSTVAAYGYVDSTYDGYRYYVMDVQRGNLVVRTYAWSDGGTDDQRFRELVAKQAERLAELVPVDPATGPS